jgi:hypothetical protein
MIDTWHAVRPEKYLRSGRTSPIALRCVRTVAESEEDAPGSVSYGTFLVKAIGRPEVTHDLLFREAMGTLIAREIGVPAQTPALVIIDDETAGAINAGLTENFVSEGIAFGVEYVHGGVSGIVAGSQLPLPLLPQAAMLFALDMVIQNPDRTPTNPNCGFVGNSLVVYDFDMSFSFLLALGRQPKPWETSKFGLAQKHLFYSDLKARPQGWEPFLERFQGLTESTLARMVGCLPGGWHGSAEKVCAHLTLVVSHQRELHLELARCLL